MSQAQTSALIAIGAIYDAVEVVRLGAPPQKVLIKGFAGFIGVLGYGRLGLVSSPLSSDPPVQEREGVVP
jgi:hypothetical protein